MALGRSIGKSGGRRRVVLGRSRTDPTKRFLAGFTRSRLGSLWPEQFHFKDWRRYEPSQGTTLGSRQKAVARYRSPDGAARTDLNLTDVPHDNQSGGECEPKAQDLE